MTRSLSLAGTIFILVILIAFGASWIANLPTMLQSVGASGTTYTYSGHQDAEQPAEQAPPAAPDVTELDPHALEHGGQRTLDAWEIWLAFQSGHAVELWDCPSGRLYMVMRGLRGALDAFVVLASTGTGSYSAISAYFVRSATNGKDRIRGIIDRDKCTPLGPGRPVTIAPFPRDMEVKDLEEENP